MIIPRMLSQAVHGRVLCGRHVGSCSADADDDHAAVGDPGAGAYARGAPKANVRVLLITAADRTELTTRFASMPPYPAGAYELNDLDRNGKSLGERQWRRALNQIAECYDTGNWSDPWEGEIISLGLPAFAFSEESYRT